MEAVIQIRTFPIKDATLRDDLLAAVGVRVHGIRTVTRIGPVYPIILLLNLRMKLPEHHLANVLRML